MQEEACQGQGGGRLWRHGAKGRLSWLPGEIIGARRDERGIEVNGECPNTEAELLGVEAI